jgi:hypothetical protein
VIWIVYLEVLALLDPTPEVGKLGFINVVLTAERPSEAQNRVVEVLEEYGWEILGFEHTTQVDPDMDYSDELNELIEDVLQNPEHVRLGMLHSYRPN